MVEDRTVRLGVRQRIIVGHGGRRVALSVFCPRELRSTDVDVCRRCPRAVLVEDGSVTCVPDADQPRADSLVGAAMGKASIAIEASMSVADVIHLVESDGWLSVVVLDGDHRALGLIQREQLVTAPSDTSAQSLVRPVLPVFESFPLLDVVHRMVRERARALPVVDQALTGVGIVTDLDALRWAARTWGRTPKP